VKSSHPDLVALETFWKLIFKIQQRPAWIPLGSVTLKASLQTSDLLWRSPLLMKTVLMVVWISYTTGLLQALMVFKGFGLSYLHL